MYERLLAGLNISFQIGVMEKVRGMKQMKKNRNFDKSDVYIIYKNFGEKFSYYSQLISSTFCLHDHAHFFLLN